MNWSASWVEKVTKILAGIGVAALLGFGIIGAVNILRQPADTFRALAALFTFSREKIAVTADPATIDSGGILVVRWQYEGKREDGSYQLSYPCRGDFDLVAVASGEAIACNAAFPLGMEHSVSLIPRLSGESPINIPLSISFTENGVSRPALTGAAVIVVTPSEVAVPAAAGATPPPPTPAPGAGTGVKLTPGTPKRTIYPERRSTSTAPVLANGISDLAIEIIDTGIIDDATGNFNHATSVSKIEQAGVVFDVFNIGTAVSLPWKFSAALPIYDGFFLSDTQSPLAPGERIRFTIGFKLLKTQGANVAVFTVDPTNSIKDKNRANDSAQATVVRSD